jgi:predicted porin
MKPIIPFALLLSLVGAAHAESAYSIYGLVDVSYGKSVGDDAIDKKADFHSGGDAGSGEGNSTTRIGVKGGADLGSGVKANFKFETGGIGSDGSITSSAFFNRQAWFGFSGGFGEVRFGRQDSVSFQTTVDFDFNGASNGVAALGYSQVAPWLPGRQSRSLQYISPNFGGFTAQVGLQLKGNNEDGNKDVYSLGLKYAAGPLAVAVTGQSKNLSSGSKDFAAIVGSFDFGVAKVQASYADGGKVAEGGTGKGFGAGVVVPVAGINIGAQFGKNTDSNYKTTAYELFINKEVFKNTYAYAEFGNSKWKDGAEGGGDLKGNGFAIGVIFTF